MLVAVIISRFPLKGANYKKVNSKTKKVKKKFLHKNI